MCNAEKLSQLASPLWVNTAVDSGQQAVLEKITGARKRLYLKVGAPVIITANIDDDLVNGTKGVVVVLDPLKRYVRIKLGDGTIKNITKFTFYRQSSTAVHSRTQFPLQLAWALTIHRAQGQTLPKVHVLCSGLFLPGHFTVAISRVQDTESEY